MFRKILRYYESTIRNMLECIGKPECQITTEDLRSYLDTYQRRGTVSKVTLDNVRRILSSFLLHGWKTKIISSRALLGESTK